MDVANSTTGIDLSSTWDGLFWSFLLATVLSGITIVQGWIYINNCDTDPWSLRILVVGLILADFVTTALDLHILHFSLIENFGDLGPLGDITLTAASEFTLTMVIVYIVQLFFASRVYFFNKHRPWLAIAIVLSGTAALTFGLMAAAQMYRHRLMSYLDTRGNEILFGLNGGFAALADVGITVSLTWTLASSKRGIKQTDTVLQKLLLYIVSRGLLVSITQVLFLVIFLTGPGTVRWAPFHFMASKLYVITMVAMLNARNMLRDIQNGDFISTSSFFTPSQAGRDRVPTQVFVHKTIESSRSQESSSQEQFSDDRFYPRAHSPLR
ncbi:hypothetical protein BJ138DRAFT_1156935 [Hygrophoropsis aurantiaca]|uniref:Uncharacterized protein n=1 Tax=Hygrophoropsis aurantiaca TaxID=72124 RepID=A0ACB8A5L8_9AGAM|nr:hypothetical protein BJ138DRAFT_1156935 [Hygrophoropsis aurantiaca]